MARKTAYEKLMLLAKNGVLRELESIDRNDFPVRTPGDNFSKYNIRLQDILNQTLEDQCFKMEYEPLDERYGRGGYFFVTYKGNCIFPPNTGIGAVMQGFIAFKINPNLPIGPQIEDINRQWSAFKEWVNNNRRAQSDDGTENTLE